MAEHTVKAFDTEIGQLRGLIAEWSGVEGQAGQVVAMFNNCHRGQAAKNAVIHDALTAGTLKDFVAEVPMWWAPILQCKKPEWVELFNKAPAFRRWSGVA